jgi:hypothetical protein
LGIVRRGNIFAKGAGQEGQITLIRFRKLSSALSRWHLDYAEAFDALVRRRCRCEGEVARRPTVKDQAAEGRRDSGKHTTNNAKW